MDPRFIESNKILHNFLRDNITSSKPFLIGRLSCCEPIMTNQVLVNSIQQGTLYQLSNNAGIYCCSLESLRKWAMMYYKSLKNSSLLGIWEQDGGMYKYMGQSQDFFLQAIKPTKNTYFAPCLDAFFFSRKNCGPSWEEPLRGKKILIISPFVDSIKKQIQKERLSKLFRENSNWFSNCTFEFVKPPMTQAGNHNGKDWQDSFQELCSSVDKCQFDVALVSCGGYGMLICNYMFESGKSSIYVGGCLQLFFGILGSRWEKNEKLKDIINEEFWMRPSNSEKPSNFHQVEGGCYW